MFSTARGSRLEPFGCVEWALLCGVALIWGSSAAAWGVLLMVAATIFYGFALNLAVPLQQRYGAPAVMCGALGVAAVAPAPFGLADSRWGTGPVLAVTVLGVVGTGAAFVIMAPPARGAQQPGLG